jgi:hypothetical protein
MIPPGEKDPKKKLHKAPDPISNPSENDVVQNEGDADHEVPEDLSNQTPSQEEPTLQDSDIAEQDGRLDHPEEQDERQGNYNPPEK